MTRILVGTADGLHGFEDGRSLGRDHAGRGVTALARDDREVWTILDGREIRRTESGAWSSASIVHPDPGLTCLASTDAGVLVGLAGAHLARVVGDRLEAVPGFEEVQGREDWFTPWGGPPDTRSMSEQDEAVYVNVHVGGIVRSRDSGATWTPTIDIDADVHRVWAGPPGVFAACARGLAVSLDDGVTWEIRSDGLHARYCRGVTLCADTVLVSASAGPRGGRAAVYRARPEGGAFERCERGLPEWFDGNVDSAWLDATPEVAAFATAQGSVFASTDAGASWDELAGGLPAIGCLLVMP